MEIKHTRTWCANILAEKILIKMCVANAISWTFFPPCLHACDDDRCFYSFLWEAAFRDTVYILSCMYDAYRTHTKEIIRLKENKKNKKHSTGNYGTFETETEGSAIPGEIFWKTRELWISEKRLPKILDEIFLHQFFNNLRIRIAGLSFLPWIPQIAVSFVNRNSVNWVDWKAPS